MAAPASGLWQAAPTMVPSAPPMRPPPSAPASVLFMLLQPQQASNKAPASILRFMGLLLSGGRGRRGRPVPPRNSERRLMRQPARTVKGFFHLTPPATVQSIKHLLRVVLEYRFQGVQAMNRTFRWPAALALALLMLLTQNAPAQDTKAKKIATVDGITEYQRSNGAKFLLFPDPASSKVTLNMVVLVGSRHEGYGESGMAHLLEHMNFKGTPTFPAKNDIDKALLEHGAENANATTYLDRTNYYET